MNVIFTVRGTPQPQGSTRSFIPKGWTRAITTSANKNLKPWRQQVSEVAMYEMNGQQMSIEAVAVTCNFFFIRPKSIKKNVTHKTTKPDIDKCARSILDSLTGVCFRDDSQVVSLLATKDFCDPGVGECVVVSVRDYIKKEITNV